jgi:hypothetical protein
MYGEGKGGRPPPAQSGRLPNCLGQVPQVPQFDPGSARMATKVRPGHRAAEMAVRPEATGPRASRPIMIPDAMAVIGAATLLRMFTCQIAKGWWRFWWDPPTLRLS